ncbi:PH domain-containing protein [Raoultibacter massiliensis]|uniref:PH domain-containing protein n=1 Tax=Raoultibacter massiliensis TaxID=1852371 RepID=UPI000C8539C7|nr:PH domain-containing protein [Raoultibacter massiliensis]
MTEEQRQPESGMPPVPPGAAPAQQPYSQPNQQPYQQPAPGYYPSQPMPAQPVGGYVDPAAAGWQQPVQNSTEPVKHRVHHSYIWLGSLQVAGMLIVIAFFSVFSSVIGAIADGESIGRGDGPVLLIVGIAVIVGLIVIVGLTALIQTLSYKHLYYEIGPDEFNLYSGIFNKKRVHVPYQRIQSVNQKATLVQRLAGVCTVNIDTAGGSANKAVVIPYLQNSEAERLRTELFARKQAILSGQVYQDAIPGQPGSQAGYAYPAGHPAAGNVLDMPAEILTDVRGVFGGAAVDTGRVSYEYGMSNKELVLTGLSNNTGFALIILAAIGSVAGLAEQILSTAIGRMLVDNGIDFVTRSFAGNTIWAITGIVVAVFLVVWVFSIIGACISYGGFKARRRDSRIEVEHGLLQHRFHGVDIDRVQSVIVKQSFIRRLLGYCELSLGKIDAAAENSSEDQQKSLAPQGLVIHPFVKMDRVPEILAGLVPEFADVPTESRPVAKPALRRAIIRRGILQGSGFWLAVVVAMGQIVVNAVVSPTNPDAVSLLFFVNTGAIVLYVLCVLLLVLDVIGAVLWYRGSGFAYNRRFMQISNGGFSRESVSFPRKKIQYGFTKTNPFQRNARVATINARTAAGIGGTTLRLIDVTEQDAETWLDWVKPGGSMVQ